MKWTDEEREHLVSLVKSQGKTWKQIAKQMSEKFDYREYNAGNVRGAYARFERPMPKPDDGEVKEFQGEISIDAKGLHKSTRLVEMVAEDAKSPEFLLESHGYDPDKWKLVGSQSKFWDTYSKIDKIQTLFASSITAKPREGGFTTQDLVKAIEGIEPREFDPIQPITLPEDRLFEISLFDMHLGITDFEYYKPTQEKIYHYMDARHWEEILFTIGQDLFHNNDLKGNTANGTPIEQVDMDKAWEDAFEFYEPLLLEARKKAKSVRVVYSPGNHDETIAWAFVKSLQRLYKKAENMEFDTELEDYKIHTFGDIFLGLTHGEKTPNKTLANVFQSLFPVEFGRAKVREIHKGHLHGEEGIDHFGTMVRTLSTRNKTDKWHKQKGLVGRHKRFMIFEYSPTDLEDIHFV